MTNRAPPPSFFDVTRGARIASPNVEIDAEHVQEIEDALLLRIRSGYTPVRAVCKVAADHLLPIEAVEKIAMQLVEDARSTLLDPDLHDVLASDMLRGNLAFMRLCQKEAEKPISDDELPIIAERKHAQRLKYINAGTDAAKGVMELIALRDPRYAPGTKNTLEVKIKGGTTEEQALVALLMGEDPKNLPRIAAPLDAEDATYEVVDART